MKPGMKIWIILVSIVLFWGGVFYFACCADNLEKKQMQVMLPQGLGIRIGTFS